MKKSELRQIIKEEINEISPELFKRATDISRSRGQDRRTISMGETFFSKFRGKPLMGGTIINVYYQKPQQAGYENVTVKIESPSSVVPGETKSRYVTYDVKGDSWDVEDEITRADARILSLIAQHIEPNTRYKSGGEGFRIKGYGSNESLNENSEKYMFFQNLETIKKEVEEMKALLKRAKEYDEKNNEPNCEIEEKMVMLRKFADAVGIDLDDVIKKKDA